MRPLRFRSRSAIPTSRSARMCSRRWRATTRACAGPRSRSTTGTTPRTRSTASPSRRMCSIASRRPQLPRSSIIVSDEPLSGETNYRTEFVAVLNNQPQGGFVTRRPTADVAVASEQLLGRRRLRVLFPAQLELPDRQYASARRPVLLSGATGLVVRCGTPRRPNVRSGCQTEKISM